MTAAVNTDTANLCPKCNAPRVWCERKTGQRRGGKGWWKCPACARENDRARREKAADARKAEGRGSNFDNRRNLCLCDSGGADICPVHAKGEVERRILADDPFWQAITSGR